MPFGQRPLGFRQDAGAGVTVGERPGLDERLMQQGLLVGPVGIGGGRATAQHILAIGAEQRHVDAVERGAGHQPEGAQQLRGWF